MESIALDAAGHRRSAIDDQHPVDRLRDLGEDVT